MVDDNGNIKDSAMIEGLSSDLVVKYEDLSVVDNYKVAEIKMAAA